MRKNFLISLVILIGIAIFITACDFDDGTPWQKAFKANVSSLSTTLTANTWADGNLSENGWQWFKFTATASTQYIHVSFGTLTDLYVKLYDSTGNTVGNTYIGYSYYYYENYYNNYDYNNNDYNNNFYKENTSQSLTSGQVYYIKVTPYGSSYSGTYRIAFNESIIPPTVTMLTANTWADGNLSAYGEQWFEFTATADTQYIHVSLGTLDYLCVQVYDSTGNTLGSSTNLYGSYRSISRSVTSGQVYYIKVTPYSSSYSGTYRIAFSESFTPPS
ncbi:hypothetical protein [Treponema sp. R80B11-R83G3]